MPRTSFDAKTSLVCTRVTPYIKQILEQQASREGLTASEWVRNLIIKELKEENGGLMALSEVVLETNKRRPGMVIAPGYIVKAVEKLENEKLIPGIKKLKSGSEIVEFFPVSMTTDGMEILSVAAKKGWTTLEEVILKTEWNRERAKRALEALKKAGIARLDKSYSEGEKYYFPGLGGH